MANIIRLKYLGESIDTVALTKYLCTFTVQTHCNVRTFKFKTRHIPPNYSTKFN